MCGVICYIWYKWNHRKCLANFKIAESAVQLQFAFHQWEILSLSDTPSTLQYKPDMHDALEAVMQGLSNSYPNLYFKSYYVNMVIIMFTILFLHVNLLTFYITKTATEDDGNVFHLVINHSIWQTEILTRW